MAERGSPPTGAAFLLAQLGAHAAGRYAGRVAELELDPAQTGVLHLIAREPGRSQQALADRLGVAPSRVVALVDGLEGRGLLERRRSSTDRRTYELHLTVQGRDLLQRLRSVAKAHEDDVTTALSAGERLLLVELLRKVADQQGLTPGVHPGYRKLPPAGGMSSAAAAGLHRMTRVIADISVSLDGFVTGPDPGPGRGLGAGGEALHTWALSDDPDDRALVRQATARSGAVVLGRRLFDIVDAPGGWDDEVGYGAGEVGKPPFVVVTSSPPASVRLTDLDWTFVTTGVADAVDAARERVARDGLDVVLMGGGATIDSALAAGLVDVLSLHLAPVVLGGGTPLFTGGPPRTLLQRSVLTTSTATHLTYDAG